MSRNEWVISPIEEENGGEEEQPQERHRPRSTKVVKTTAAFRRLDTLLSRVETRMKEGKVVLERLQEGENLTEEDNLVVDKLDLAINSFVTELRGISQNEECDDTEKWDRYTQIQLDAEDLLLILQRSKKIKLQEDGQSSKASLNITSRLPKMDLLKFDGNKLKWFEFWGRFKSSVEGRKDLSDIDKLSYLLGLLEGEAKEAVEGLDVIDANYAIAIDALTRQFGKPDMIIDAHYEALSEVSQAKDNTKDCRRVLNEMERHMKILKTLGEKVDTNNQLRHLLLKKFPQSIRYDLSMMMRDKENTVANLRQALAEVITAREASRLTAFEKRLPNTEQGFTTEILLSTDAPNMDTPPNRKRTCEEYEDSKDKCKASTQLYIRENSSGQSRDPHPTKRLRPSCVYCGGDHYPDQCTQYSTVEERKSRIRNRCLICLRNNHRSAECKVKSSCYHCRKPGHHRSLCFSKFGGGKPNSNQEQRVTATICCSQSESILQTVFADIQDSKSNLSTSRRILFDTGSQRSYVSEDTVQRIRSTPIEETCLSVYTFGQPNPKNIQSQLVCIQVMIPKGEPIEICAYVIPSITGIIPSFQQAKDRLKHSHPELEMAQDLQFDSKVDVLIGNDHYHSFFTGEQKKIEGNLYVVRSKLGWILSGCSNKDDGEILSMITYVQKRQGENNNNRFFTVPDPPLQDDNIRDIWELETIGIRDSPKILEEDEIIKFFNQTTTFENNRYLVKWPWLQYPTDLPVNYGMAFGRLTGLMNRIDRPTLEQYNTVLQEQLSKGVIEIVEDSKLPNHAVHYLPHHCVVQDNKTTKLRVVYDASAKSKGHCSLNEYLYKGPCMLEDLVSLVLRFREHPIGITADVEKAFLQVGLQPEDRDVTRFLWIKDTEKGVTDDNIVHYRFCRVPFGIISSPFLLAATIKYHLARKHSEEASVIERSLYVDNLVTGSTSVEGGAKLYHTATEAFKELSMNIRGWCTNSSELKQLIPEEQHDQSSSIVSVLGLKWDTNQDTLKLAVDPSIFIRHVTTKREVLRIVASIFDPCGYVSPLLLPARLFLQQLWTEKYKWDTPLSEDKITDWGQCVQPLQFIHKVEIPRYHFETASDDPPRVELHCFSDASKDAYSSVVYVRRIQEGATVNITMSRTRLTPIKWRDRMTIPKLELLGVLIGARLLSYVKTTLGLKQVNMYLWTDSQIVLRWMKSEKLLEPFVSRRISEIKSFPSIQLRYISSKENPADLATRVQLSPLPHLWLKGPYFLRLTNEDWKQESSLIHTHNCVNSTKPTEGLDGPNDSDCSNTDLENEYSPSENHDVDLAEAGKVEHTSQDQPNIQEKIPYSLSEVDAIQKTQHENFPKERMEKTHLSKSLGLFVDDQGLLRCKGRMQNAMLPYDQKFPILLPKNNPFTFRKIKKIHEENYHVGVSQTLTLLRKRFWVPHGRSQVIAVLKTCKQCIKHGGGPFKLPAMPPLPAERVQYCRPFTYTGLDYLGPLTVLNQNQQQKRWCCLYTCMASRAIRLDTVNDLTAEEFLLSLRRFVAMEGVPALIVSDNAAQFKLTAEILESSICSDNNIAWHFIPALSPWHGGFYERLVGLVKHCLRRTLDKNLLSDNQLITVLKEVESVLNNRPLTTVGNELELVLTPADFMTACGTHPLPGPGDNIIPCITATKEELVTGWKKGQELLTEFITMFKDQYLAKLRERAIRFHKQPRVLAKRDPKVGDIVQLGDDRAKIPNRANWKVGKIEELIPSSDGQIRTAKVKLDTGSTVTRSISMLYPLELFDDTDHENGSLAQPAETTPPRRIGHMSEQIPQNGPKKNTPAETSTTEEGGNDLLMDNVDTELPSIPAPGTSVPDEQRRDARPRRHTARAAREFIRQWTKSLSSIMAETKPE